jgi:hypothetical protein
MNFLNSKDTAGYFARHVRSIIMRKMGGSNEYNSSSNLPNKKKGRTFRRQEGRLLGNTPIQPDRE